MRILPAAALLVATGLTVASCSGTDTASTTGSASSTESASASAKAGEATSIEVDNCGFSYTLDHTPERITTMEQGATDTLLLLGAKEQIAGYGHQKDAPPAGYDLEGLKEISPSVPNTEQLRDADTDFILSPFIQSWTPDMAGPREEWKRLGVGTYSSNTECRDAGDNKGKTGFELVEKDLTELGAILGREKEAKELIVKQNDALNNAEKAPEGTTFIMLYSSVGGAPYIAGGPSIVTEIGEATGMKNAFGDVKEEWPQVSWEAIAEADPDVIILGDLPVRGEPGDTWQEKVADLESNPGTKEMKAVKNGRYIVVPGVTTSAGARSYESVNLVSEALRNGILEHTGTFTGK